MRLTLKSAHQYNYTYTVVMNLFRMTLFIVNNINSSGDYVQTHRRYYV